MAAAMASSTETERPKRPGISSRAAAGLSVWGNWYIMRTSHEFGWGSHNSCLSYYGMLSTGHRVLFDTPEQVRLIDAALGQLHETLRHALVLKYCWHRDLKGNTVRDAQRAEVLGLDSASRYREMLRTAKWLADKEIAAIDHRRENATIG